MIFVKAIVVLSTKNDADASSRGGLSAKEGFRPLRAIFKGTISLLCIVLIEEAISS